MLKHTIIIAAIAGLVLALAPVARAVPITINNPNFEIGSRGPGVIGWDVSKWGGGTGWNIATDHWLGSTTEPNAVRMYIYSGATRGTLSQDIGTVSSFALNPELSFSFDAKWLMSATTDPGYLSDVEFAAYFAVDGVRITSGEVAWTSFSPATVPSGQWDRYTVTTDVTGMTPDEQVAIVFEVNTPYTAFAPRVVVDTVEVEAAPAATDVPGDVNGDQVVNDADLALFEAQFGGTPAGADFDGDGDVDLDDFATMRGNWGFGTGGAPLPAADATPEPATMSLLALGGLTVLRKRRRRA